MTFYGYGTVLGNAERDDWSTGVHAVRRYWEVVGDSGTLYLFPFLHYKIADGQRVEIWWTGERYELRPAKEVAA